MTVYRRLDITRRAGDSSPREEKYRNSRLAGQKGRLHADTLDHEKVVFEDHCFLKVRVNLHNCYEEHIEVYRNGIKA